MLLILTAPVSANNNQQSHVEQQGGSMHLNQKMQQCMSLVDMDVIQSFKDRGLKLNKTIKTLCENNNRNKAQNHAVGFAVEIQRSKDLSIFKQCGRIVTQTESVIRQILKTYFVSDLRYKHICDHSDLCELVPEGKSCQK